MPHCPREARTLCERSLSRRALRAFLLAAGVGCPWGALQAQSATQLDLGGALQVGGEAERYVRALQLAGVAPNGAWTIRPLYGTAGNTGTLAGAHPWQQRFTNPDSGSVQLRLSGHTGTLRWLRPSARLIFNSTFPATTQDGPTWAGRGITGELQAGAAATFGPLRIQVAPVLFLAQNQTFVLTPNGAQGTAIFRDSRFPQMIDAPQRFGTRPYGRLDAGNSTVSLALPGAVIGVSTAAQAWGPAREYPLILGPSSGGFLHAFLGTKHAVDLKAFSLQVRLIAGTLAQSEYSPVDTGPGNRWASAGVIAITPRGVDGLELGVTRFVEGALDGRTPSLRQARRVLSGIHLSNVAQIESENQLASAFFRWAFPGLGFEVYGEYAREDYSLDARRFLQYPDDLRSYEFGLQRVFRASAERMHVFRFETVNAEVSSSNRGERGDPAERKLRTPFPPYLHEAERQGHTNRGLFLGSPEAYGGAGWRAGVDKFTATGRTSLTFERSLRFDWLPTNITFGRQTHPDVIWAVSAEALRFAGGREYLLSVTPMFELNRNLVPEHDVLNLRAALTVRGWR